MTYNKILVIDLELTCWETKAEEGTREIIKIGLVELDALTLDITRTRQIYVKPTHSEISKYCTSLTGISNRTFKQAFDYEKTCNILQEKFGSKNKMYVGWGLDNTALIEQSKLYGVQNPFSDNYLNLSQVYSIKKGITKKYNLKEAITNEGLTFEGQEHSGLDDAINTAILFKKIFKEL